MQPRASAVALAAVVAALASPAEAAPGDAAPTVAGGFTVYGIADVTVERVKSTGQTSGPQIDSRNRVSSNSSYIGFRGETGLSGQRAFFQAEYGTNYDAQGDGTAGTNQFSYRDIFLGLGGNWGDVRAGQLTLPIRSISGKTNYNPGSTSISETINLMTSINGTNAGFHSRKQNAIQYTTPVVWNGFSGALAYGANEERVTGTGQKNPQTYGLGLYYEGPGLLSVYYAYEQRSDSLTVASPAVSPPSKGTDNRLVFRFNFGQGTRVLAGFDWQKVDGIYGTGAAAGNGSVGRNAWTVAASQTFRQHEFILEYARARAMKCDGAAALVAGSSCVPTSLGTVQDTGARQVGFVYHYYWTKDLMIQAFVTQIKNNPRASYDFDVNPTRNAALQTGTQTGASPTGIGAGIRYAF
jgi:Gram-negative porin